MSETREPETDIISEADELALAGKFDEALKKYEDAAADDPYNPAIAVGKSAVLKAQGKFTDCAKELEKAIDSLSSWTVATEDTDRFNAFAAMLHVLCAEAYLYAEERENVFRELDAADRIREADAASLLVRANAHAQAKEWENAGNLLYRAEEWCFFHDDSMLTQVWLTKVHCAKEAGGIFAPPYAAEVYAKKTWRMPKGTAAELQERAANLRKEGLLYDALRYYDACLEANPENRAHVLFLKGVVMEQLKRFDDAFSCYADALSANPEEKEEFAIRVRWANTKALRGTQ
ncbi:MAG TPA: hypothetical protein O0X42_02285 [Methanocorpusculum sp.]|nr:hypothetical protein [Methanocorpusculum sp.]